MAGANIVDTRLVVKVAPDSLENEPVPATLPLLLQVATPRLTRARLRVLSLFPLNAIVAPAATVRVPVPPRVPVVQLKSVVPALPSPVTVRLSLPANVPPP